jgi:hypothetical protein
MSYSFPIVLFLEIISKTTIDWMRSQYWILLNYINKSHHSFFPNNNYLYIKGDEISDYTTARMMQDLVGQIK